MGQVTLKDRVVDHAQPLILLATSFFCKTALSIIANNDSPPLLTAHTDLFLTLLTKPYLLLHPQSFRHEWFRRFFAHIGPTSAARPETAAITKPILTGTKGVILDIGPGQGDQLQYYAPYAKSITHIYGIEPTTTLHAALLAQAKQQGLGGKYTALNAGASPTSMLPALRAAGLDINNSRSGVFDRVIALKSLCSCPQGDVEDIMRTFQYLLKPGGDFVFLEHVGNKRDGVTQMYQWVLGWIWPAVMGGCRLDGRMEEIVKGMSGWQSVVVNYPPGAKGHEAITFVTGKAIKA